MFQISLQLATVVGFTTVVFAGGFWAPRGMLWARRARWICFDWMYPWAEKAEELWSQARFLCMKIVTFIVTSTISRISITQHRLIVTMQKYYEHLWTMKNYTQKNHDNHYSIRIQLDIQDTFALPWWDKNGECHQSWTCWRAILDGLVRNGGNPQELACNGLLLIESDCWRDNPWLNSLSQR